MIDTKKITVVSHDAGGAELLSSYVRRNKLNVSFVLDGPAVKIYERKLGSIENLTLIEGIEKSNVIICSTSWQSDIEYNAIRIAKEKNKKTIAVLDHWINYKERFIRNSIERLPHEIWVGDNIAYRMARQIFEATPIKIIENPYFQDLKDELQTIRLLPRSFSGYSILYVCEPVKEHARRHYGNERHWGYTEDDALKYFLNRLHAITNEIGSIKIRPHPSENIEKYNWVKNETILPITFSNGNSLITEVAESDIVVGCESMAMVVGLIAGKRVISTIPPEGRECQLPQVEIEKLKEL